MPVVAALLSTLFLVMAVAGYRMYRIPVPGDAAVYLLPQSTAGKDTQRGSLLGRFLSFVDRVIGGRVLGQMSNEQRAKVRATIARAGSPSGLTVDVLIKRQATWAFLGLLLALLVLVKGSLLGLPFPVLGWFFPRYSLLLIRQKRTAEMEKQLPDFLDVLAVTISAGLGFRSALRRVASLVDGPVSQEMLVALRQIDLGASRRAAFVEMRERTAAPSLHNFITAFLQAEELGTPLGGFLESYAKELRRTAGQRARTAAAKANPKISLLLTLIIMPAISLFMIGSIILMAVLKF